MYEDWLGDLSADERRQLDIELRKVMRRVVLANPDIL
jgi:hypothetical protein